MFTKKKRMSILCIVICAIFCLSSMVYAQPSRVKESTDEKVITKWVNAGLITGYKGGNFKPNGIITRAEFVTLVNRVFGFTEKVKINFKDVPKEALYYNEVAKATAAEYLSGYDDGNFKPNKQISNEEVATVIFKTMQLNKLSDLKAIKNFKDIGYVPLSSKQIINAVVAKGYMTGYSDKTFKPTKFITKGETVVVLDRAVGTLLKKAGVYGLKQAVQTIEGNVTISVKDVKLNNKIIKGDLFITPGVGDGNVDLDNITVIGRTIINGGGSHTIAIKNSKLNTVIMDKNTGEVLRVFASGRTSIGDIIVRSGVHLMKKADPGVTFGKLLIEEGMQPGEIVELDGDFESSTVDMPDINVIINEGSKIGILILNAKANVSGRGLIGTAYINSNGSIIEQTPSKTILGTNANQLPATDINLDKSALTLSVNETYQLKATVLPEYATNKNVKWVSDKDTVAKVDDTGKVTAIAAGTANIQAKTEDGDKVKICVVSVTAPIVVSVIPSIPSIPYTPPTPPVTPTPAPAQVISITPVADINVAYATDILALPLPATITLNLSNSTSQAENVTWDTSSYGNIAGTYTFQGTYELPVNITNPNNIQPSVRVIVGDMVGLNVLSVDSIADKYLVEGTLIDEITLPTKVTINLSNSSIASVDVTWNTTTYNRNTLGTYILYGTLTLPQGIINTNNITASIRINVVQPVRDPEPNTHLKTSSGTVIDECDSLVNWSKPDYVNLELDTKNKVSGDASLNITSTISGSTDAEGSIGGDGFLVETPFSQNRDLSEMDNVEFNIYIPDVSQVNRISLRFFCDNTTHNRNFYSNLIGSWRLVNGWNRISRLKTDFMSHDLASWDNITSMGVVVFASNGCKPSINLDRFAYNISGRAKLLFNFDDAWYDLIDSNIPDNAFSVLESKGFKATTWVNRVSTGEPSYLSEADLDNLYSAGWDIGNHTVNHYNFADMLNFTDAQIQEEYEDNQNWILQNNWDRGANFVAYPSGMYNEHLIDILQSIGVKAARTTTYGLQSVPVDNMYKLKCIYLDITYDASGNPVPNVKDIPKLKKEIDTAIETGSTVILMIHKVENTGDPLAITTADFKEIVEYVSTLNQQNRIDVSTISEWYNDYMGTPQPSITLTGVNTIEDIHTGDVWSNEKPF